MHGTRTHRSILIVFALIFFSLAASIPTARALPPTSWNWRNVDGVNYVSGVRNQQQCGIDFIMTSLEMIESREMIAAGRAGFPVFELNYSEQYVLDCGSGFSGNFTCVSGGWPMDVLAFCRDTGVPLEECDPYLAQDSTCPSSCPQGGGDLHLHRIPGPIEQWDDPLELQLTHELTTNGPIVVTMDLYDDFWPYTGGIYQQLGGTFVGVKTMLLVGYGSTKTTDYWICKNTWGTSWGESGYFRIIRGGLDGCNFAAHAFIAAVDLPATAVDEGQPPVARYQLSNHPNPFNPRTTLNFTVTQRGPVTLTIHDASGRRVRMLVDEVLEPGTDHSVIWDGRNDADHPVPSGVYFARLRESNRESACKLALIR